MGDIYTERNEGYVKDQMALRQNATKHTEALSERPETTPSRKECSEKMFELATKIFERARQLKESGELDKFKVVDSGGGSDSQVYAEYQEDEDSMTFMFKDKVPGAMTINRVVRYWTKEGKGRVSTWNGLPAGLNHNLLEINFWTGENATANGSSQDTNSGGPHQEDIMTDEQLIEAVPKVTEQFEEAVSLIETGKE